MTGECDPRALRAAMKLGEARDKLLADYLVADADLAGKLDGVVTMLCAGGDNDSLTALYKALRSSKQAGGKAAEKAGEIFDGHLEAIETALLKKLLDSKAKSMTTSSATFYREEVAKPSCADWPAFHAFIIANNCPDALEKRVTKAFVDSYVEEHGELPPGISLHRETRVRVRTTNQKD